MLLDLESMFNSTNTATSFPPFSFKYAINLLLRSIFHATITGLAYISIKVLVTPFIGLLVALLFALYSEIAEARKNEDNSQNPFTLNRDAVLFIICFGCWIITLSTKEPSALVLLGLVILLMGSSRMIDKIYKKDFGVRDKFKVAIDIVSLTAGPPLAILLTRLFY